jgi:hypothetical protein
LKEEGEGRGESWNLKDSRDFGRELAIENVARAKIKNKILRVHLGLLREELKFVKKENRST